MSRAEISKNAADSLVDSEKKLLSALEGVDASTAFSAYSFSRMWVSDNDPQTKSLRPSHAAVELAAWLLYPHFGKSSNRQVERIQEVVSALNNYVNAFTLVEMLPELPPDEPYDPLTVKAL